MTAEALGPLVTAGVNQQLDVFLFRLYVMLIFVLTCMHISHLQFWVLGLCEYTLWTDCLYYVLMIFNCISF